MPRRYILTASERAGLVAIPTDETALIRLYTLSEQDLSVIKQRRGDANRLGFAVLLCCLRYPGYALPAGEDPPHTFLTMISAPVDSILAERGAKHINVNILRYFSEPATLDDEAKTFLQRGMTLAMEWAAQGLVVPHVGRTIDSTVEAINAGLRSLKAGTGTLGKVAVIVDRDLVEGS